MSATSTGPVETPATPPATSRWHFSRRQWLVRSRHAELRHEVENLNGHEVDVTYDAYGVVELRPHHGQRPVIGHP